MTIIQAPECPFGGNPPTTGIDINELGHVVGEYCSCLCDSWEAFVWTPENGLTTLERPPGVDSASATHMTDLGLIVGTVLSPATRAFVYDAGEWLELPPGTGGAWSMALGIGKATLSL